MSAFAVALLTAVWLGVLTSISPCPLATNLAAISFIARQLDDRRKTLLSATAYVVGRTLAYAGLGGLVVAGLLSIPGAAAFLDRYMNRSLGPVLVLVGMALLDLLPMPVSAAAGSDALRQRAARSGPLGALLLGILFALSFCPVSAALFFGSLVPLALTQQSSVLLPAVFGLGTGLPVFAVGVLIATGAGALGSTLQRLDTFQKWARRVTGVVFIGAGVYTTVVFIFLAP